LFTHDATFTTGSRAGTQGPGGPRQLERSTLTPCNAHKATCVEGSRVAVGFVIGNHAMGDQEALFIVAARDARQADEGHL
jgi:hypothetical protein